MIVKDIEVTLLAENTVEKRGFIAEHGLSFWIRYGENEYLFDTGQGHVLLNNLDKLNINLSEINSVILSHGHDDHCGGLKKLLEINPEVEVIAHEDAFLPKYKMSFGELVNIGANINKEEINNFINVENKKMIIEDGLYITGVIDVDKDSYINDKYIIKKDGKEMIDPFNDDISLYMESDEGIVILLGCSHKGVVNIIEDIREKTGYKKIKAILGGMHLKHSSEDEITEIVNYLNKLDFDLLAPIHCTGYKAAMMMKERFGDKVKLASTADSFSF